MSSSTTGTSSRASSSKSATATRRTSISDSLSSTSSSSASITSSILTTETPTITNSVPAGTPTEVGVVDSKASSPVAVIVIVVIVALGLIASGVAFFLCRRKRRKQSSAEEPLTANHEPKRAGSRPESMIPDVFARTSSTNENYYEDDSKSAAQSLNSGLDPTSRAKPRSSRASSSIFVPDDTATVASRSHFLRPVSLGEPIAFKNIQAYGQMPTLPESPLQSGTNMEKQENWGAKTTSDSSNSSEDSVYDTKSTHIVTVTRPATPEIIPPVPPIPAQLPPLPPFRYSLFKGSARRDSTNSLTPYRLGESSRPQSMISIYSTKTDAPDTADALSPDVHEVLSRLKRRISTPWSINSVGTSRTERMSVTRASIDV